MIDLNKFLSVCLSVLGWKSSPTNSHAEILAAIYYLCFTLYQLSKMLQLNIIFTLIINVCLYTTKTSQEEEIAWHLNKSVLMLPH